MSLFDENNAATLWDKHQDWEMSCEMALPPKHHVMNATEVATLSKSGESPLIDEDNMYGEYYWVFGSLSPGP